MTKVNKDLYPDVQPGTMVKVHLLIKETNAKGEEKERIQIFDGMVLARKHGAQIGSTITVRKVAKGGYGVEKIFPLNSPIIPKIEVDRKYKVTKSKLYFLRHKTKKYKMKEIEVA